MGVYSKNPSKDMFVETHGSDLFVNMLMVLHQEKVDAFADKMDTMMNDYYAIADASEQKKVEDRCKIVLNEIKEKKDEKWDQLVASFGNLGVDTEEFAERARAALAEEMLAEFKQKVKDRFPAVVVPGA